MQHEQSKLTPLQRIERLKSTRTPDRLDNTRHVDSSVLSVGSPRRKLQSRQSSAVLNTTTVSLRKLETESYNLDVELAYCDYLGSHAELILEHEALKDAEKSLSNSIKSLCEETKALHEKCLAIEIRTKDVMGAACLTDYQDKLALMINAVETDLGKYEISNILSQLKELLNRFNILRCENIILPTTEEEVQEFKKTLTDCCNILQKISDPNECKVMESFTEHYKEFTAVSQEITSLKNIIEGELFNVQSETLKTCSHMFAQNNI